MPRRWHQVGGGNSVNDGGKKARSPGRARRKPLKPLRAGMPGDSGELAVNTRVHLPLPCAHEAAGSLGTRHSPRPLMAEGGTNRPKLARNKRRDREAVFASGGLFEIKVGAQTRSSCPALGSLGPGIHVFLDTIESKTWMAGTSPATTNKGGNRLPPATPIGIRCPLLVLDVGRNQCSA
jgi:hypothetical protein